MPGDPSEPPAEPSPAGPLRGDEAGEPWSWSAAQIERAGVRVAGLLAEYLGGLPGGPVRRPFPAALRDAWAAEPAPRAGRPAGQVLGRFAAEIAPYPLGNGHPAFAAWVNSPPAVIGVFAEALAAAMNPSVAGGDHAAVHLERQVIRWLAGLAGLPEGSGGLLVSGASMATLTALAVARHRVLAAAGVDVRAAGLRSGGPRLVLYATIEAHGCVRKAAELLGIGSDNIMEVATGAGFAMSPASLAGELAAGRRRGDLPLAVVASAGTVNTGAVDPIGAAAAICAEHGAWLHVDAAYGGPAVLLLDELAGERAALGRADSIAIDPHKWLYVPVDAGALLLRDMAAARDAFSLVPPYLRTGEGDDGESGGGPWFSEFGFEQTRPFRALKIWMALQHIGLDGYAALIARDLRIAEYLRASVADAPDLELLAGELSIACFRYLPDSLRRAAGESAAGRPEGQGPAADERAADELNGRLAGAIQDGGRAFLAGTTVHGRQALRACIVNPGTTRADIDALLAEVRAHGQRLLAAGL